MIRFPQPSLAPRRQIGALAFAAALVVPTLAGAQQVGYPPEQSPYRDVPWRQELTAFGGWFAPQGDPAGVAPRGGPMAGLRYDIRLGGPAAFYARAAGVLSERTVIDPTLPPETRESERTNPLMLADLGIAVNLTGQKSWRYVIPALSVGVGVASDFRARDEGGYRFGTPLAIALGGGFRYVPGGNFQLRVDVTDHLYQIRYPGSYFTSQATGVPAVLGPTTSQSSWRHNVGLTVGASWLFSR